MAETESNPEMLQLMMGYAISAVQMIHKPTGYIIAPICP
jgi:hypothetical protein